MMVQSPDGGDVVQSIVFLFLDCFPRHKTDRYEASGSPEPSLPVSDLYLEPSWGAVKVKGAAAGGPSLQRLVWGSGGMQHQCPQSTAANGCPQSRHTTTVLVVHWVNWWESHSRVGF